MEGEASLLYLIARPLPISATVVKIRMGSRFCIFAPRDCSSQREQ
jgi:hypothetical protein